MLCATRSTPVFAFPENENDLNFLFILIPNEPCLF